MIVYMVNIVAEVIALPDENGFEHVTKLFLDLQALNNREGKVKTGLLVDAMKELAKVPHADLPSIDAERGLFFDLEPVIDGEVYEIRRETVKALRERPIHELRLSIPEFNWHFRATFFPFEHPENGKQFYCMVFPFEKILALGKKGDPTDIYRNRTKAIYDDLVNNFQKYHSYFENSEE